MKYTSQHGFTLLELLTALVCVSILVGLAVPSFREFTRNNRVAAAQNDLATALNLARSESLRRSKSVTVCASTTGNSCGTKNDWASGWIVFTDTGAAGTVDGTDKVLQQWPAPGRDVTITVDQPSVRYLPTGQSAASLSVTIDPYQCIGKKRRSLTINGAGSLITQLANCP